MPTRTLVLLACLLPAAGSIAADTCTEVVDATVAELRAGSRGTWSSEAEDLIRAAAGSACVKAVSGRYGVTEPANEDAPVAPVSPEVAAATGADQATAGGVSGAAAEPPAPPEPVKADDGSWSFGGLTFRGMSGSPSKKPYQRQRVEQGEEPSEHE